MTANLFEQAEMNSLRKCIESYISRLFGSRTGIATIRRKRFDGSTAYACHIVTVQLTTGDQFTMFLKDFGPSRLPKDSMEQRRERELKVYRDLLVDAGLGTARFYGSVWDESRERFWLLLEFVEGSLLRDCDIPHWIAAAGWLGRLHGHFAQGLDRLAGCGFLECHGADYFRSKADLAGRAVSLTAPHLADRFATVTRRYDRVIAVMANQPATLIHGSFRPQNILVGADSVPARICPVDWELAALGPPFLDLAFIADGFEPPTFEAMIEAYRGQLLGYGIPLPGQEELVYVVNCFRLHKIVKSLAESRDRRFSENVVAKLIDLGERVYRLL